MRDVRPGHVRCSLHGGSNLASKIRAEQMMAQARLPAIETLYRILEQAEAAVPCPTCGFPNNDTDEKRMLIQACRTVLDRTGMGPSQTVELTTQNDGAINLDLLTEGEKAELLGALAQIRHIKAQVRARQMGDGDDPAQKLMAGTLAAGAASDQTTH